MQIAFGKTKPAIAVKFTRLVEIVLEQIENQNLSVRLQNFVRGNNGGGGNLGMVQRLAQNHEVNAVRVNRRVLQIAEPEFQIFQSIFFALAAPNATIFSELSTAMTFFARRASSSLNKPSPAPKSATTSGGKILNSKCPNACHERPGP